MRWLRGLRTRWTWRHVPAWVPRQRGFPAPSFFAIWHEPDDGSDMPSEPVAEWWSDDFGPRHDETPPPEGGGVR